MDIEDDAARQNWGGGWRTPTDAEWTWLRENCTWTSTTQDGVNGMLVRSNIAGYTDNSIFLPGAGYRIDDGLYYAGPQGYYWSSSLYERLSENAWYVSFNLIMPGWAGFNRSLGQSIRPVTE